jgi:signal transduction histidine kinase
MTDQTPSQTGHASHDLEMALASARQSINLLISQATAGRMERDFLIERLEAFDELLAALAEERRSTGQQQRLAALYDVSRLIGSSLDLQIVLDQVMDAIIKLTGAERGFLMLLDDDGNLVARVARNIDQQTLESGEFHVSRTVTRQVVDNGQPVLTTNAQEDPRFAGKASVIANALRSIMATPLRVRGRVTGVIYVDNRARAGLFKLEDLAALDTFAGQAAVAIDNARLFAETDEALQARVEELSSLRRVDRELNEAIGEGQVLAVTLKWATRMAGAENGALGLIEYSTEGETVLRVAACYDSNEELDGFNTGAVIPLHAESTLARVLSGSQPQHGETHEAQNVLFVPVYHENQPIGTIILTGDHDFTEEERDLVGRMAARAAIAIQNTRLFEAVKAADRAKSEFVSVVAHELKTPMTSIAGYADLLRMAGPVTTQQSEFISRVKDSVTRMQVLVTDLSDISRIESGNLRMEFGPVNPTEALVAACDSIRTQIEERGHRLVEAIPPDLPPVLADRNRLNQVLLNLLSNAYKYTPDGGTITLSAARQANHVAFSVADTGIGMSADEVARLGTKFWRADNDRTLSQPGTGLGFAITRNVVALMGGVLTIQSAPGQGSIFTFTIPVAA